jgi:hypothetical protein
MSASERSTLMSKPYRLKVIGASLADQLATGLRWEFGESGDFIVSHEAKPGTGLVRTDVYDWQAAVEQIVKDDKIDIVVVALGGNDRQSFFHNGRRLSRFSETWRMQYYRRLQRFMRTLTDNVPVVYWVSLPKAESPEMSDDFAKLNSYVREVGTPLGIKYIDIYGRFADGQGNYSSFGNSLTGERTQLRQEDGIHFTMAGARKLGHIVSKIILADLQARTLADLAARTSRTRDADSRQPASQP